MHTPGVSKGVVNGPVISFKLRSTRVSSGSPNMNAGRVPSNTLSAHQNYQFVRVIYTYIRTSSPWQSTIIITSTSTFSAIITITIIMYKPEMWSSVMDVRSENSAGMVPLNQFESKFKIWRDCDFNTGNSPVKLHSELVSV